MTNKDTQSKEEDMRKPAPVTPASQAMVMQQSMEGKEDICYHPLAKLHRAILYTDTIGGEQVLRDDMWAVTTKELNDLLTSPTEAPETESNFLEVDIEERKKILRKHEETESIDAIKDVISGMVELAEKESTKRESYKKLDAQDSLGHLIDTAQREMILVALDTARILEKKYGIKVTKEQLRDLYRLPYLMKMFEDEEVQLRGWACSVDRAYARLIALFKKDI